MCDVEVLGHGKLSVYGLNVSSAQVPIPGAKLVHVDTDVWRERVVQSFDTGRLSRCLTDIVPGRVDV